MSENTPDYQCPRCMFGYLGFGPSKAWYAGESNNPNLCRKLDGISDASRKKNKLLRHWKHGDFPCPGFALPRGVRADGKAISVE